MKKFFGMFFSLVLMTTTSFSSFAQSEQSSESRHVSTTVTEQTYEIGNMTAQTVTDSAYGVQKNQISGQEQEKFDYLIGFRDRMSDLDVVTKIGGKSLRHFKSFDIVEAKLTDEEAKALAKHPHIKSVEKETSRDFQLSGNGFNETALNEWITAALNVRKSWDMGFTGKNANIAILDSGISSHEDLNSLRGEVDCSSFGDALDNTCSVILPNTLDNVFHGTFVAGIISGKHNGLGFDGIAPDAHLYNVKVTDDKDAGIRSGNIVAGLEWVYNFNAQHANEADKIHIINMSLGSNSIYSNVETSINKLEQQGVLMVASSGNDAKLGYSNSFPASLPNVIGVGAVARRPDQTGLNWSVYEKADFSETASDLEITAPGVDITSDIPTVIDNPDHFYPTRFGWDNGIISDGYYVSSGTSFSAPMVSGVLALLKEQFPTETGKQLYEKLIQKAKESQPFLINHVSGQKDSSYGWGILDGSNYGEYKAISPTQIQLLDSSSNIYDYPTKSAGSIGTLAPQMVTAYEKWGDWYRIATWLGLRWVKPEAYNPEWFYHRITLNEKLYLYDAALDQKEYLTGYSTGQFATLDPQTVNASQKYGEWYKVSTGIGEKWVHPKNSFVDDFPIRLTEYTVLYNNYGDASWNGWDLNPQDVWATWRVGDWYKIKTSIGEKWIHPSHPIIGSIENRPGTLWLARNTWLFDQPFSDRITPGVWPLTPQEVNTISRWNDWYLISTSLGSKWVFVR